MRGIVLFISLLLISSHYNLIQASHTKNSDNEFDYEEETLQKDKNNSSNNNKARSGFYSGIGVDWINKTLKTSDINSESKDKINIKKNGCNTHLLLGYDHSFGQILFGGELDIGKQFCSNIKYSVNNVHISDVSQNIGYSGIIKLGFALDTFILYGTIGSQLSKNSYNWKQNNHPNIDKQYKFNLFYGTTLEKQFNNHFFVRLGYIYDRPIEHKNTKVNVESKNMDNIKISDHKVSISFGYRF